MKIGVCIKEVLDTECSFGLDPSQKEILLDSDSNFIINPYDEFALEEGLKFKDKDSAVEIVLFCLGPERAVKTIHSALAMGADRAVHVIDNCSGNYDSYRTASILKQVIEVENLDLVLLGKQSIDLNNHQVGPMLAEFLGWPHVMDVIELTVENDSFKAWREVENGGREVVMLAKPFILGVTRGINQPRYPSLKSIMAARKKEVRSIPADTLSTNIEGLNGLAVEEIVFAPDKGLCKIIEGEPQLAVGELVRLLRETDRVI